MFAVGQKVRIFSTAELKTRYAGKTGEVTKVWARHPEFFTVLTSDGNTTVFHQSQLAQMVPDRWDKI